MRARILVAVLFALVVLVAVNCVADTQSDRNAVLNHLNTIISWYRDASSSVKPGELPSDAIFQENVRSLAGEAVQLAFQAASAEAVLLGESSGTNSTPSSSQDYSRMEKQAQQDLAENQSKLEDLEKQIAAQSGAKRKASVAERDELNGQIALDKARLETIQKMSQFVELNAAGNQGFDGSIKELADAVPEVLSPPRNGQPATQKLPQAQTATPITATSAGIIGQLVTLYDQVQSLRSIDRLRRENRAVTQAATVLRDPLRDSIRAILKESQQAAAPAAPGNGAQQPVPNSPPASVPNAASNSASTPSPNPLPNLVQAAKQFNQISDALLPLSQELIVLDQTRSNLEEWRASIASESKRNLIALLFRVLAIAVALGIVWFLSDVWRRLTFRYIPDARRRRQFLVLRRFVMGFFFSLVFIMGFVSEFGSLATYAGFVTAGIAVGLQTVLLSVAAYFFVVGRYGIRIGDRISVAGVTGDVVDVGLTRLYIMEMAGTGVDLYPTGRIAVFSNSVLFQPTTPLYKQVPGTQYAWHEAVVTLAAAGDHKAVHDKLLAAVNSVYDSYRGVMELQQGLIGDQLEIVLKAPVPEAKFQLNGDGMALLVRYPVPLARTSETDDRVAEALIGAISADPAVKEGIVGTPKIQAAVKG